MLVGLLLSYIGLITPRGAGFYCDDRTITHTYTGDTISVPMLFLGTLLAPVFFVSTRTTASDRLSWSTVLLYPSDFPSWICQEIQKGPGCSPATLHRPYLGKHVDCLEGRTARSSDRARTHRIYQRSSLWTQTTFLGHMQAKCNQRNVWWRVLTISPHTNTQELTSSLPTLVTSQSSHALPDHHRGPSQTLKNHSLLATQPSPSTPACSW